MSTPVNTAAVNAMGGQFNTNVFKDVQHFAVKQGRKSQVRANKAAAANKPATPVANIPQQLPNAPIGGLPANAVAAGRASRQAKAQGGGFTPTVKTAPTPFGPPAPAAPVSGATVTAGRQARQQRAQQANTPPLSPQFSSAPSQAPHHAIPAPAATRAAPGFSAPQASAPAINQAAPKPSTNPFQVNTMQTRNPPTPAYSNSGPSTPAPSAMPTSGKTSPVNPQFSNVSTKDNSPFPTHVHPEGSSNQILPRLTAAQSSPGKPNEFTVGSRSIKGGGIASMGSQLEAGLSARPLTLPQPRKRV
jgi:hypothetical protein